MESDTESKITNFNITMGGFTNSVAQCDVGKVVSRGWGWYWDAYMVGLLQLDIAVL